MMKQSIVYVIKVFLCLCLVFCIGAYRPLDISNKEENKQDIRTLDTVKAITKSRDIDGIIQEAQTQEVQIVSEDYHIDNLSVGDDWDDIYKRYHPDDLYETSHTIEVINGRKTHYGIATESILYIKDISIDDGIKNQDSTKADTSNNEGITNNGELHTQDNIEDQEAKIREIQMAYTTPFVKNKSVDTNEQLKNEIAGNWKNDSGREISFQDNSFEDSYLDALWEAQYYQVISPYEIAIRRQQGESREVIKLNVWLDVDNLYVFVIDEKGYPIQKSIEVFYRQV